MIGAGRGSAKERQLMFALGLMAVSVFAYGVYPVIGALARDQINPVVFVAIAHAAALAVALAALTWRAERGLVALTFREMRARRLLLLVFCGGGTNAISHAALFGAFYFLAPAVATLIYESWPVLVVFMLAWMAPKVYERATALDLAFSLLACVGLAIVTFGDERAQGLLFDLALDERFYIGLALALVAAATMAISSAVGVLITNHYRPLAPTPGAAGWMTQVGTKIVSTLGPLIAAPAFGAYDAPLTTDGLALAVGAGVFIVAIGSNAYLVANSLASRTNINLFYYLTPVVSLLWLAALGLDQITATILLGALMIIIANLLATLRSDTTLSFTATMLALQLAAAYVFFLPGLDAEDLFELLAAPTGIFAILVAFLIDRVSKRRTEQETLLREIAERLEEEAPRLSAEVRRAYVETLFSAWSLTGRRALGAVAAEARRIAVGAPLRSLLERFCLVRFSPFSFGELVVLWVLGVTVATFACVYRATGEHGFLHDLLAVVLTASIAFLVTAVLDQRSLGLYAYYRGRFEELTPIDAERAPRIDRVSPQLATAIVLAAFVLLVTLIAEKNDVIDWAPDGRAPLSLPAPPG